MKKQHLVKSLAYGKKYFRDNIYPNIPPDFKATVETVMKNTNNKNSAFAFLFEFWRKLLYIKNSGLSPEEEAKYIEKIFPT